MKIDDRRHARTEVSFDELEAGKVYISHHFGKYMMCTSEDVTVCLETGEIRDRDEHTGDIFYPVKATLIVE